MTPENFVYWLQGVLEIADPKQLDEKQIQIIKDHIKLILRKETPNYTTIKLSETCFKPNLCFCSKCNPASTEPLVVTC
jgi:hypothetical protein